MLFCIIGIVLCIDSIADDKYLHIIKQTRARSKGLMLVSIYLIKRFLHFKSSPFQLDLHKWKAVYQNGYIVSVFKITFLRNLIAYLKLVLTPMFLIDKLNPL